MTYFCELEQYIQMCLILLTWLACVAEIIPPIYRIFHRRSVLHTVVDSILSCGLIFLLYSLARCNLGRSIFAFRLPTCIPAAVVAAVFAYAGISFAFEFRRSRREITEWSVKEAVDDLPVGLMFADSSGHIILCNRKMNSLSRMLTGVHPQTVGSITDALASLTSESDVQPIAGVSDYFRFPDGSVYRFCSNELNGENLSGYVQLSAFDETEIYDVNVRLEKNNEELELVNRRLQIMYDRMADDVREKESLDLKVWLHDTIGSSLLTIQDLKNSSSKETKKKINDLKEAVGMLSANRCTSAGTFEDARQKAEQLGVKVTLNGLIPAETNAEQLISAAVRECVTNCIRHAKGDAVYVKTAAQSGTLRVEITNSGEPPRGKIIEGSGLSSLRRSVEAFGGVMHVLHSPVFSLVIYLPIKENSL